MKKLRLLLCIYFLSNCSYKVSKFEPTIIFALLNATPPTPIPDYCARIQKTDFENNGVYSYEAYIFNSPKEQCAQSALMGNTRDAALEIEKKNYDTILSMLTETDTTVKTNSNNLKNCSDVLALANKDKSALSLASFGSSDAVYSARIASTKFVTVSDALKEAPNSLINQLSGYYQPDKLTPRLSTPSEYLIYRSAIYTLSNKDCYTVFFGKNRFLASMAEFDILKASQKPIVNFLTCYYGEQPVGYSTSLQCKTLNDSY